MRTRLLIWIFGLVTLSLAVWAAISLSRAHPANESTNKGMQVPTMIVEAEAIPLYPDAQVIEVNDIGAPARRSTLFTTQASPEEVVAFYKQQLLEVKGWLLETDYAEDGSTFPVFLWSDPQNVVPWRLYVLISMYGSVHGRVDEAVGEPSMIRLIVERWPDARRIPLFPGAQQVEAREIISELGNPERITVYQTSAQVDEVKAFYRTIMPQQGWDLSDKPSTLIPGGMHFSYSIGSMHKLRFGGVGILVESTSDGRTRIEVCTAPLCLDTNRALVSQ